MVDTGYYRCTQTNEVKSSVFYLVAKSEKLHPHPHRVHALSPHHYSPLNLAFQVISVASGCWESKGNGKEEAWGGQMAPLGFFPLCTVAGSPAKVPSVHVTHV